MEAVHVNLTDVEVRLDNARLEGAVGGWMSDKPIFDVLLLPGPFPAEAGTQRVIIRAAGMQTTRKFLIIKGVRGEERRQDNVITANISF